MRIVYAGAGQLEGARDLGLGKDPAGWSKDESRNTPRATFPRTAEFQVTGQPCKESLGGKVI